MKRIIALSVALLMLTVPVLLAKDAGKIDIFRVGKAEFGSDNQFTVSLEVIHDEDLAAMDIPLTFSKGVTLNSVTFEGTRVADFDVKIANIENDKSRVTIGLLAMVYALKENSSLKPLPNGDNKVAVLHFTLDDASLKTFEIGTYTSTAPTHELQYVYNEWVDGTPRVRDLNPEFEGGVVALDASAKSGVALPTEFGLSQNTPNPFNPTTRVSFALKAASQVNLAVYNVLGQHVTTLVDEFMPAGYQNVTWDGSDKNGHTVASGVYFYKLRAGEFTDTKKMLMLK